MKFMFEIKQLHVISCLSEGEKGRNSIGVTLYRQTSNGISLTVYTTVTVKSEIAGTVYDKRDILNYFVFCVTMKKELR